MAEIIFNRAWHPQWITKRCELGNWAFRCPLEQAGWRVVCRACE